MRIEILLFLVAGFVIANIYTDGKYLKIILSKKKYFQMAGVAFVAFMLYILIKRNPLRAKEIMTTSNEYIKYLPIDKNTSNIISPILDFTVKQDYISGQNSENYPILNMNNISRSQNNNMMMESGKKATKRCVSETKKKYVASRQGWKCNGCGKMLNATFEVDHIKRLEYGGDNHVDNLRALCRECHGNKTMMENL